jgi:RCC1 and BTB domain-containing protein
LDTDPPPHAVVAEPNSLNLVERRLRHFFNDEEFSDVTFLVQGRKVHAHKMILSMVSQYFRTMFTSGFRESESIEVAIPDCSYNAFLAVIEYIYTGNNPILQPDIAEKFAHIVDILELSNRFCLNHLKEICEALLQPTVNSETVEYLLQVAQDTFSFQLQLKCEHFLRNRDSAV